MSLELLLDEWLLHRRARCQPHTLHMDRSRSRAMRTALASMGLRRVGELTCLHLRQLLARVAAGRSAATRAAWVGWLRKLCRFALGRRWLEVDISAPLEAPKVVRALPRPLEHDQVRALVTSPDTRTPVGLRDRAVLEVLYGCGLRRAELASLTLAQVDLCAGELRVLGKGPRWRVVPLSGAALTCVCAWLAVRPGWNPTTQALFLNQRGGPLSDRTVGEIVKGYARRCRLPRVVTSHTLRQSCATHMLSSGAGVRDVQELLGHEQLSTTQRYTEVTLGDLLRTYDRCHPRA